MQLSARIRELLREVQDTHGLMQKCVAKEEKKLAKGKRDLPYTQEDLEAHREITELVGKHIVECQVSAAHALLPVCCRCAFLLRCAMPRNCSCSAIAPSVSKMSDSPECAWGDQSLERKRYAGRAGGKGGVGAATGADVKRSAEVSGTLTTLV